MRRGTKFVGIIAVARRVMAKTAGDICAIELIVEEIGRLTECRRINQEKLLTQFFHTAHVSDQKYTKARQAVWPSVGVARLYHILRHVCRSHPSCHQSLRSVRTQFVEVW